MDGTYDHSKPINYERMKRVIIDYKKLTPEILSLLLQKFPDGYNDKDIVIFDNHHNETIEAVEVNTTDTIYLVKVSSKLHYTMTNFDNVFDKINVKDLNLNESLDD